jgi:hypothetical protein
MKTGDLVKIQDGKRLVTGSQVNAIWGVVVVENPYDTADDSILSVRVMWQNGIIGLIRQRRLEVIHNQ